MIQPSLFDTEERGFFEQICSVEQLAEAYCLVRKKKGVPGVDGQTFEQFGTQLQEELEQLSHEVKNWIYIPQPVKRVRIPKPDNQGERLIGIPTVKDRVLQQSIRMSLEERYEPTFSESSFGFRPNRGQQMAITEAHKLVSEGKEWIVDIDLEQFFDTINHDRVIHLLRKKVDDNRLLRLIGITLRSGILENGYFEASQVGTTQGSPLSPLLSNVVLDELDKELEERNLSFCRYADDCNIFVGSEKAAKRVMKSITKFIETRLKLKVNQSKSKVAKSKDVKFLGMTIMDEIIMISAKSLKRAMKKVKELTRRGTHLPLKRQIEQINQWYLGWSGYYRMTQIPSQLRGIEAHIRRRLRSQFVGGHKRRRFLYRKVRKMGVKHSWACKVYDSTVGRWKMTGSRAVNRAWNNEWFVKQGLKTISDQALYHWLPLNVWKRIS